MQDSLLGGTDGSPAAAPSQLQPSGGAAAAAASPPACGGCERWMVGPSHSDEGNPLVPRWWLFFIPLYWFPQRICWGLIETYLVPFQIEALVGEERKHSALALTIVASNIGSFIGPIWGALSDKSINKATGRRRRRPWVVGGQLLFCIICTVLCEATIFPVFFFGYASWTATATISGAPYVSIYTAVPTEQRGVLNSLEQFQALFNSFIVSFIGVLIGEKVLSNGWAYVLCISLSIFPTIPIGLIGLGESPTRPMDMLCGRWAPEVMAPAAADADSADDGGGAAAEPKAPLAKCSPGWWVGMVEDFTSAHRYPPFRWLFITNAFNTCYSTTTSLFFIYWFQDDVGFASTDADEHCFHCPTVGAGSTFTTCPADVADEALSQQGIGDYCYLTAAGSGCTVDDCHALAVASGQPCYCRADFTLFGRHISNSPQTALAFNATVGTILSFVLTLPGGWIADRWKHDRAMIMLISALVQTICPIVNAFLPTFTWVCITQLLSGVVSGLTGAAAKSIQADCVPIDAKTGKPRNPARDFMVMSYSGVVPRLVLPGILGVVIDMFADKNFAYKCFFLAGAALHLFSSFLYLKVKNAQDAVRKGGGPGGNNEEANSIFGTATAPNRAERLLAIAIKEYGRDSPQYLEVRDKVLAEHKGVVIDPVKVADIVMNNTSG
eukprot:SAG22_NODE_1236_length_5055_cov_12.649593_5_plen_667_part_00